MMTTANKLTMMRIVLVPVFLAVLYLNFPGARFVALALFILAGLTDTLDGYIARRYQQVTNIGKFLDPLADKMLVLSAMAWLVEQGQVAAWVMAVVLLREFAVSGLRMVAVEQGKVIAAAWSGKVKTFSTIVCLCIQMVFNIGWLNWLCQIVILATTLYSGVEYFRNNRQVFSADR